MATSTKAAATPEAVMVNTIDSLQGRKKELIKTYLKQEKRPVVLAPMYAPYFGNILTVSINGISIRIRVDGSSQMVPSSFADEIDYRRMRVDEQLRRLQRGANIKNNLEHNPGELPLY